MDNSEKKNRFVKQANLFLSYALGELQADLERMAEKGLDQDLIDRRTNVINHMIEFYNAANDIVTELDSHVKMVNISNKMLESRLLGEQKRFSAALGKLADMIPINKL